MMQSIKYAICGIFMSMIMLLSCVGCASRKAASATKPCVVVSIPPLYGLVKEIVGEDFDVLVLLPEGSSPEMFSPTIRQVSAIRDSELFFSLGLMEFEKVVTNRLAELGGVRIIDVADGCQLIDSEGVCCHLHCQHEGVDPHVWMSPFELEVIVENIGRAICEECPDSAKYLSNTERLIGSIKSRQEEYSAKFAKSGQTHFLIYHPALSYLARDYGLHQIALENEGKNPTPISLAHVVDIVDKFGIADLMYQSEYPQNVIKPLIDILGVNLVKINPLNKDVLSEVDRVVNIISSSK